MQPISAGRADTRTDRGASEALRRRDPASVARFAGPDRVRPSLDGRRVAAADLVEEPRRRFGTGWVFWFLLDISLLGLPIPLIVTVPPVVTCRSIAKNVGFYAGESFSSCASKGIAQRWERFDGRIKMLVRQSGR